MDFESRIKALLVDQGDAATIGHDRDLSVTELGIDSLTFMDRIMTIEEQESIILTDEDVDAIVNALNVSDIVKIFSKAKGRSDDLEA